MSILIAPLMGEAQPPAKILQIGLLSAFSPSDTVRWPEAFRQGLRDLGWVEGRNISIEYRYAEGKSEPLPHLAADLVRLKVDIIVTAVTPDTLAAKNATRTSYISYAEPHPPDQATKFTTPRLRKEPL